MKNISNIFVLVLISIGLILGLVELILFLNKLFMYFIGCGLSILIVLASIEIYERANDN